MTFNLKLKKPWYCLDCRKPIQYKGDIFLHYGHNQVECEKLKKDEMARGD